MRHDTTPAEIARRLADTTLAEAVGVEAFVVISSVDLELARRKRNDRKHSRRQLTSRLKQIPDARAFCAAIESGGLPAARAVADAARTDPPSVWWCDSREAYEQVLSGIYERLLRSPRPHDACDHGACGPLAWIVLWPD